MGALDVSVKFRLLGEESLRCNGWCGRREILVIGKRRWLALISGPLEGPLSLCGWPLHGTAGVEGKQVGLVAHSRLEAHRSSAIAHRSSFMSMSVIVHRLLSNV